MERIMSEPRARLEAEDAPGSAFELPRAFVMALLGKSWLASASRLQFASPLPSVSDGRTLRPGRRELGRRKRLEPVLQVPDLLAKHSQTFEHLFGRLK